MALSKSKLTSNLTTWMNDFRSISEAATTLSSQYESYAMDAEDVTTDNPLDVFPGAMANTLEAGWEIGLSYEQSAAVIESGIQDFWDGGTFALNTPPSGAVEETEAIVTAVPPTGSIKTTLATNMSQGSGESGEDEATMAELWADPIHSGTEETVVKCTGVDSNGNTVVEEGPIT